MNDMEAARALSALGHETRLAIFRTLVQAGPDGLAAGDIARRLDLAPSVLSFHLKDLRYAGLTGSRQAGRFVIYSAVFSAMTGLLDYLTENCCGGADCVVTPPALGKLRSTGSRSAPATSPRRKVAGSTPRNSKNRSKK
ncbi:MAG: helix-turn-helix transcriptional regulator [Betaproteobacteria bacterium]|jgi:DNA-binding transcriptional ArsR family regulator|nr:MAG: helix-turn-helix transcriptional regulator [Betaproteobacteria bacterium]